MPSVYISLMPATTGVDPRRLLPSVDQALQRPEVQALVGAHGRPAVVRALRSALDELRRRAAEDAGRPRDRGRLPPGRRGRAGRGGGPAVPPSRPQRHRGRGPHEPRPRAALPRGRRARGGDRRLLLEPRVRPRAGRARRPRGPRRGAPARAARGRGDRGREQLRGGGAPRRQHARRGARGPGEPGRARRDRGLLPHPGRAPQGRRAPARGRDHQPDAPRRLPGRALPRHRHDPEGPPEQLPHRRLHGAAPTRGARRARRGAPGSRSSRTRAAASSSRCPGPSPRRRRRSRPCAAAPTS